MKKKLVLLGSGGHASVVLDAALASNAFNVLGYIDFASTLSGQTEQGGQVNELGPFGGLCPYLGDYDQIPILLEAHADLQFVTAIGSNRIRAEVATDYPNLNFATIMHPSAVISPRATVGIGTVVLANATINAGSTVGPHCIVNTGVILEHDSLVGSFSHLAPGCVTGGGVHIGHHCLLGLNSTLLPQCQLVNYVIIGAGAVVVENIQGAGTYVGIPARPIHSRR